MPAAVLTSVVRAPKPQLPGSKPPERTLGLTACGTDDGRMHMDKEQKMKVLTERYRDEEVYESEDHKWQEEQIRKATVSFGTKK